MRASDLAAPTEYLELNHVLQDMVRGVQEILANPDRFSNRFYQVFIVLSYCRMLHSLQTCRVESKLAGADWAKRNLDPSWIELIDGSWAGRPDPAFSVRQAADPQAFAATLQFVQYCIEESKR